MPKALLILLGLGVVALSGCAILRRKLLFYPTHHHDANGLAEWKIAGAVVGYSRSVANPANVWLMLHGNGGQAADRVYALGSFSARDSVFILEYPGYGLRAGQPSKGSFDAAASDAYQQLCDTFPGVPVGVVGESIGSGPACRLAQEPRPPAKIVLVVPFDELSRVAADHFPLLPVSLFLFGSTWNNIELLEGYKGPVEIFGAREDTVIAVSHAKALADATPSAKFHLIEGGHNDWSQSGRVEIRNP